MPRLASSFDRPDARPTHRPARVSASRRLTAALAAWAGLLGGCATDAFSPSPQPGAPERFEDRRAGFPIRDDDFARLGYRQDWVGYPPVAAGGRIVQMSVYNDIVSVVDSATNIAVLETGNGQVRWKNQLSSGMMRIVGLSRSDDGRILASSDAELFAMRIDTGDTVLRQRFEKVVNTAPVLVGDTAVYGTAIGEILAHGLPLGTKRWGYITGAAINLAPVPVGEAVGVVTQRGDVVFVNPITGTPTTSHKRMFAGAAAAPISTGSLLIVPSLDQSLYAFSPEAERAIWRYRTSKPLRVSPAYHAGRVYCEIEGSLTAFESSTGKPLWTAANIRGTVVAVRNNRLVVWDGANATLLEPEDGGVVATVAIPGATRLIADTIEDGNLYIASASGLIAKFIPR
ncbi:MAG: PQQ-binding-like beta-propeller repeat protein [Phycisphaeraceae bacterium]|nr:MAG: PQQ-binding-like beta-propeller repeat protein [Phycisphaeraceae bacterium]